MPLSAVYIMFIYFIPYLTIEAWHKTLYVQAKTFPKWKVSSYIYRDIYLLTEI